MTEETGSVEVSAGTWKAIFRGLDMKVVMLVILVLVISVGVAFQWEQDRRTDRDSRNMYLEQHKITQGLLNSVIANQRAIIDTIAANGLATKEDITEMTYV